MADQWTRSRRRWLGTCAGVVGTTALAGCFGSDDTENGTDDEPDGGGEGSDWPMYGVDLQNTAHHPDATGPEGGDVTKRAILDLDGYSPLTTAIVDGVVYISSTSGMMHAVDPDAEKLRWEAEGYGPPTVHDGRVYGPTDDNRIFGYDTDTGDRWESEPIGSISGLGLLRPLPTESGIIIASNEKIWRFDTNTGEYTEIIDTPRSGRGTTSWPAIQNGTMYIARWSELHAVDLTTPEIEWTFEPEDGGGIVDSNPAVRDGVVYVASYDEKLHAIDSTSGNEIWSIETDVRVETSPAIANGIVYLSDHGRVVAADTETGDIAWEATDEIRREPEDVVVVDDRCYVATRGGIWAYDSVSGDLSWTYDVPPESDVSFNAPPTISDGTIYLPSSDKALYAIEDA